ncbi:MAG: Uncharacterised protein [Hyphomonas sp. TMED17]|nr:MAG: Uncharacterised protein [Hyphomonas sp. TMED17]
MCEVELVTGIDPARNKIGDPACWCFKARFKFRPQHKYAIFGAFDRARWQEIDGFFGVNIGLLLIIHPECRADDIPFIAIEAASIEIVGKNDFGSIIRCLLGRDLCWQQRGYET